MSAAKIARLGAGLVLSLAACAGNPHTVGVYTPIPIDRVYSDVEQKVVQLGYNLSRSDRASGQMVAERTIDPPSNGADKEELRIEIAPDATGVTRLQIIAARVIPATADHPVRRVAASTRGSSDANAILAMFMKVR